MRRGLPASLIALALALAAPQGRAQGPAAPVEVDMQLVLAVDVSRSMSPGELEIQRQGYAAALTSPEVLAAIAGGFTGQIAVTYVEWAGPDSQRVVLPWTVIAGAGDAARAAGVLGGRFPATLRRTSISGALLFAAGLFEDNGLSSWRRVIDISGDGPNNEGQPVTAARDSVIGRGITVNGLAIMADDGAGGFGGGPWGFPGIADLDRYYRDCVIGGPGAFAIGVRAWGEFAAAVRLKLVLEIAGRPALLHAAQAPAPQAAGPGGTDCLIGEKLWQRRGWDIP
ncbi:MAG: DUF1194 domain-containing protein [Rhodobacteraceae bacterium]|jgi:hypothetical protein|nr:DUF1194 domain-containing protein [Paracoccaceae bacterium]